LVDPVLARRLGESGLATSRRFDWRHGTDLFEAAMQADRPAASTESPPG
jgi:hypothetical protein